MNHQITDLDQIPAFPPKPPQWEITELIFQIIGPTRWSRRQLADNLDYENRCISEYHLNQLMKSGNIDCHLVQQLPAVLDIDPDMEGPVLPGQAGIRIGNKTVSQVCSPKPGTV